MREEGETPNDRNDRGTSLNSLNVFVPSSMPFLGIRKATEWYNSHLKLNRPPIRDQGAPKLPTIVLMTEDAANRQKAENSGITSTSGKLPTLIDFSNDLIYLIVRKYVERMKESTQLLDLLAAVGSEDLEPTKATVGRQALYPDVRFSPIQLLFLSDLGSSIFPLRHYQLVLKQGNYIKDISMRINITISKEVYRYQRLRNLYY